MIPTFSAIVYVRARSGANGSRHPVVVPRAVESLLRQGPATMQVVVVGAAADAAALAPGDARVVVVPIETDGDTGEPLSAAEAFARGLDGARGAWVGFYADTDEVNGAGLRALLARAEQAQTGGAAGWTAFDAPMGRLPRTAHGQGVEAMTAGAETAIGEIISGNAIEGCAQVIARAAVGDLRPESEFGVAAMMEFFARCAMVRGVRWARVNDDVVLRRVRPAGIDVHTLGDVQQFARAARSILSTARRVMTPEGAAFVDEKAAAFSSALVRAGTGLLTHMERPPTGHPGPGVNSAACARWWGRLGYCGPVPTHLLPDPYGEIPAESAARRAVCARVLRAIAGARRVVLVGLGRNARALAEALCAGPTPAELMGFDEAMTNVPPWAAIDGRAIRLLRSIEQAPADAAVVVTLSEDGPLLARLGRSLDGCVRWSACETRTPTGPARTLQGARP